jgi:hypothetical protein
VVDGRRQAHPRVVHQDVRRAEPCRHLVDGAAHGRGVGHVQRPGRGGAARGGDLAYHGVDAVGRSVDHRHRRPLVGQQMRGRPPHAGGGAGHDRDPAGDGAFETGQASHVAGS